MTFLLPPCIKGLKIQVTNLSYWLHNPKFSWIFLELLYKHVVLTLRHIKQKSSQGTQALTLNIFYTLFKCFYGWLWAGKCRLGHSPFLQPYYPSFRKSLKFEYFALNHFFLKYNSFFHLQETSEVSVNPDFMCIL